MTKRMLALTALLACFAASAAELPYDETADATGDINRALVEAGAAKKSVLLIFGANWCADCRALDAALKSGKNADLLAREFKVVKIDVGRFDRNLDISMAYGNPIKKGIPAAVVLSADNHVLFATRAGELADARRMSREGIYGFFSETVKKSRSGG